MRPMTTRGLHFSLAAVLAAAACGGRSSLIEGEPREVEPKGGAGGTTSSSGTSGSVGGGGAAPTCGLWEQTAAWAPTGFFDSQTSSAPALVAEDDAQTSYFLTLLGLDTLGAHWLWYANVEPWSAPVGSFTELSDTYLGLGNIGDYASGGPGRLLIPLPAGQPPGVKFGSQYHFSAFPGVARPLFVARRTSSPQSTLEDLLGYEMVEGARHRLAVRMISPLWGDVEHPQAAACATTPLAAAAVGASDVFYFAAGSSRALGGCDASGDGFGAATRLQISYYQEPLGQVLGPLAEVIEGGEIERVALTLDEGALWVSYAVVTSPTEARLRVARVGLNGGLLSGPVDVTTLSRPAQLSATRLGARLALASLEKTDLGQTIVPVRVLTAELSVESSFTIVPAAANGVAIVGEPSGKRLLVAITRGAQGPEEGVVVTRYGCL